MTLRARRLAPTLPLALALLALACADGPRAPRAIVLLIGDGFGFSQLALARNALVGPSGRLRLESMPVTGIVSTASGSNAVTDSGAAATAFGAGVKTDNRYIALDSDGRPVRSIGEAAKADGWRVGYVTTTRITHATPACFYAHHHDRYDEETIASQLIEADVDLALGGGRSLFVPVSAGGSRSDDRDLLEEAGARGWTVLQRGDPLSWDGSGRLLGVLANAHLAYQLDDRNLPEERRDPSLADLTRLALEGLGAGGRPFFLLVEGGRIDHAGHEFDVAGVVAESRAFDAAVAQVLDWAASNPGTLVVLTADHATGGLSINDFARWEELERRTASNWWLTNRVRNAGAGVDLLVERTGHAGLTDADVVAIREAHDGYEACRRLGRKLAEHDGFTWLPRVDPDETHGHTGEDVPLFAAGPGAERFAGVLDNTDIAKRIAAIAGWPR
jgi:alkaline phosphatase